MKLQIAVGRESSDPLRVDAAEFQGVARVTVLVRGRVVSLTECSDPPCHALVRNARWGLEGPSGAIGVVVENEGRTTEIEFTVGDFGIGGDRR